MAGNRPQTAEKFCKFKECILLVGKYGCKGYCRRHYGQLLKTGEENLIPLKKPAPEGFRDCLHCGEIKPLAEFTKRSCKPCDRWYHLNYKYGITKEEFFQILAEQNELCAICEGSLEEKMCVDHDHNTGTVRGILCNKCNTGLGLFGDNPDRLIGAAKYLLK